MRFFDRTLAAHVWPTCALVLMGLAAACGSAGETASSGIPAGGNGGNGGVLTGAGVGGDGGASSASSSISSGSGGSGGSEVKLGPPYPLVLSHGFFGFEDFAGAGFVTYFYEVKDHLASQGELNVFTPAVDPFNSSDFRGAQLVEHIKQILTITGHEKVNIIGHSQGGLDARVAANLRPDLVASVVTVATPHGGSRVADIALDLVSDPAAQDVVSDLLELIGAPLYDEFGEQTNVWKPLELFSQPGIAAFNQAHPDEPGVFYASIAGRTDLHIGGDSCDADVSLPFIAEWKGKLDTVDPLLSVFESILDGGFGDPYPNDGLVRVVDSKRGEFWGCLPADHLDEVGQLFGDSAGIGNGWKHKVFYADVVTELRKRGY
ncbi:esterase/lipase family protein [Polyangium mundeleinium]|uniref:Alpha/beta fold hydrolase n=1 Tax=Polyangium mundeleinium TaxID=2995306 RepID=A0ABT5F439_9BACT|nr:alpha/beta fold hydrolase [Polyangium mundeleinium]MDC0747835.1 alpha/beta fold hydrolase [Polyangium mundeleinium]